MKKDNPTLSFETLTFLARHPWCFLYPFVIIACLMIAYVTGLSNMYECEAIVSFGTGTTEAAAKTFAQRKAALVAKFYFGDNINDVIKSVWPGLTEETNPLRYMLIMDLLRNPQEGINIRFDRRDQSLAHISFRCRLPDISYKVVQSSINVIKIENVRSLEESVESSVMFLTRQLNFYKDRITTIDAEMVRVSSRLKEMSVGLNVEQRDLVQRITAESTMGTRYDDRSVAGEASNADILAGIDMKLVEAKRNKSMLELRLEKKDFTSVFGEPSGQKEDMMQKAIEEKKLAVIDLKSRGALPEHPEVKRLTKAVKDLEALREKEASSEEDRELSENEKRFAERKMKEDLKSLNFTIETLEEQKMALEKYKKDIEKESISEEALVGPVATEAAKLRGLRDEKEVMTRYYNDLRKQLEDTDLTSRAEKARAGFLIDIVEPPRMPIKPLPSHKIIRFLFGLAMAIGAGAALSYLVDSLDKSVRSASELRGKFQIPVIASIDRIYTAADVKSRRRQRSVIIISMGVFAIIGMVTVRVVMMILSVI